MKNDEINYLLSLANSLRPKEKDVSENIRKIFNEKLKFPLHEEQFDDFETAYEQLKFAIELELKNFALTLMDNFASNFAWSFIEPSSEVFKDAFERALNKYTTSDQASQEQFINRVKLIFQKIFIEQYGMKDEQKVLDMADKYTEVFKSAVGQIIDKTKHQADSVGTTTPTAQEPIDSRRVDYR